MDKDGAIEALCPEGLPTHHAATRLEAHFEGSSSFNVFMLQAHEIFSEALLMFLKSQQSNDSHGHAVKCYADAIPV